MNRPRAASGPLGTSLALGGWVWAAQPSIYMGRRLRPGAVGQEGPGTEDTCPFSRSPLSQPPATAGLGSVRHTLRAQPWASHLWVRRVSRAGEYSTAVKKDRQLCLNG